MNQTDQLNLFCFMLGLVSGGSLMTVLFILKSFRVHRQLADRLTARKQVDFWFDETFNLYVAANEAAYRNDTDLFFKIVEQHRIASRRFQKARLEMQKLESK